MYLLQCLSGDSTINTTFVAHPRQSVGQELPSDLIGIIKNSGNIVIADQNANPFDYSKADAVIIVNASTVWKHICEARIRVRFLMSSPLISYVLSEHKYWAGLCLTPADIDDFLAELRA